MFTSQFSRKQQKIEAFNNWIQITKQLTISQQPQKETYFRTCFKQIYDNYAASLSKDGVESTLQFQLSLLIKSQTDSGFNQMFTEVIKNILTKYLQEHEKDFGFYYKGNEVEILKQSNVTPTNVILKVMAEYAEIQLYILDIGLNSIGKEKVFGPDPSSKSLTPQSWGYKFRAMLFQQSQYYYMVEKNLLNQLQKENQEMIPIICQLTLNQSQLLSQKRSLEKKENVAQEKIQQLEKNLFQSKSFLTNWTNQYEQEISSLQLQIQQLNFEKQQLQQQYDSIKMQLSLVNSNINSKNQNIQNSEVRASQLEKENMNLKDQLENVKQKHQQELVFLSNEKENKIKQISDNYQTQIEKKIIELNNFNNQYQSLSKESQQLLQSKVSYEKVNMQLKLECEQKQYQLEQLTLQTQQLDQIIKKKDEDLNWFQKMEGENRDKIIALENQVKQYKQQQEQQQKLKTSSYDIQAVEQQKLNEQIYSQQQEIENLKKKCQNVSNDKILKLNQELSQKQNELIAQQKYVINIENQNKQLQIKIYELNNQTNVQYNQQQQLQQNFNLTKQQLEDSSVKVSNLQKENQNLNKKIEQINQDNQKTYQQNKEECEKLEKKLENANNKIKDQENQFKTYQILLDEQQKQNKDQVPKLSSHQQVIQPVISQPYVLVGNNQIIQKTLIQQPQQHVIQQIQQAPPYPQRFPNQIIIQNSEIFGQTSQIQYSQPSSQNLYRR